MCKTNAYEAYLKRAKSLGPVKVNSAGYVIGGYFKFISRLDRKRIKKFSSQFKEKPDIYQGVEETMK